MKIAVILVSALVVAGASSANAQTIGGNAGNPPHAVETKTVVRPGLAPSKSATDADRELLREQKRMDRVMNICVGC